MNPKPILIEGRNCWKISRANRASVLVDADAYFCAFRSAVLRATRSILILGWDIDSRVNLDSRVRLQAEENHRKLPSSLGPFLNQVVSRRHGLHAYVLGWDFAVLFALEREFFPVYKLDWRTHRRLHFRMDDQCPWGASHHQKVVVIDDAVAFCGGLDLTKRRWDTGEHRPEEPGRVDPNGVSYPPFHDIQMIVDGEAAASMGELARMRWFNATGKPVKVQAEKAKRDPWPPGLEADLEDIDIGISRTQPTYKWLQETREVEQLYLDFIAAAKKFIYIENQYFTSDSIGKALCKRIQEPDGPEILIVVPRQVRGWLERGTMGVLQSRLVTRLKELDRYKRLRIVYPDMPGLGMQNSITVHAKVMIIDDRFLRVGSSNLSNRSMGTDTECDLAVEARDNPRTQKRIELIRSRLLAEHLGTAPDKVMEAFGHEGSLLNTVEALDVSPRTLRDWDMNMYRKNDEILTAAVVDPERPIDSDLLVSEFVAIEEPDRTGLRSFRFAVVLALLAVLAGTWRWTPLSEFINVHSLTHWAQMMKGEPFTPLLVLGIFVAGGMLSVPVTLLIGFTALIFGPGFGFAYSLIGSLLSAAATYSLGSNIGRDLTRKLAGSQLNKLSKALGRHGLLTMVTLRVLPIAPFSIVNLVAGASHINFRDFILGTAIGMVPGMLAISFFIDQLYKALKDADPGSLFIPVMVIALMLTFALFVRKWRKPAGFDQSGTFLSERDRTHEV